MQGDWQLCRTRGCLRPWADWEAEVTALEVRNQTLSALEQEVQESLARHPELQAALAGLDSTRVLPGAVTRRVREDNEVMGRTARNGFATSIQVMVLQRVDVLLGSLSSSAQISRSGRCGRGQGENLLELTEPMANVSLLITRETSRGYAPWPSAHAPGGARLVSV